MSIDEIPTSRLVAMGFFADVANVNRELDALRAMAHRDMPGMTPIYEGDADLHPGPWDTKADLVGTLGEALARMDVVRGAHGIPLLSEDLRRQAEQSYHEICFQSNALREAGYLSEDETAQKVAKAHHRTTVKVDDVLKYYTREAYHSAENRIHRADAVVEPLDPSTREIKL